MDAHRPYAHGRPGGGTGTAALDGLIERVMVSKGEPAGDMRGARSARSTSGAVSQSRRGGREARLDGTPKRVGSSRTRMVIITSDHGEAFGAHGVVEHSKDVYEDLVRGAAPRAGLRGRRAGRVATETRASSVDVPGLVARGARGRGTSRCLVRGPSRARPGTTRWWWRTTTAACATWSASGIGSGAAAWPSTRGRGSSFVDSARGAAELYDARGGSRRSGTTSAARRCARCVERTWGARSRRSSARGASRASGRSRTSSRRQQADEMGELGYGGGEGR